jgi:ribose transport system substrate-binding protein
MRFPAGVAVILAAVAVASMAAVPAYSADKSDQRYVMVVPISGHPFWVLIRKGAEDAAKQLGVKFEFTGPVEFDNRAQQQQIEQIAVTKPAAFLTGAFDPTAKDTIDRVTEMGVPVVTFDSDAPTSKRISFIGPNHYNIGRDYGQKIVELIKARDKTSGKVGLLTAIDQTNLQERIRGLKEYLSANAPGFTVVDTEDNRGDDQLTAERAKAMMTAHPDIDGIVVINGTGSGIGTAIAELGLAGKVSVITSDVYDPILCAIEAGQVQTTSAVTTYLEGFLGVKFAYEYVNGNLENVPGANVGVSRLPPVVDPGVFFIDKSNAKTFLTKPCQ